MPVCASEARLLAGHSRSAMNPLSSDSGRPEGARGHRPGQSPRPPRRPRSTARCLSYISACMMGAALGRDLTWDAMHRLHEKGYITEPVGKAKSVMFTEEGLRESRRLFRELFSA